jgi:hypothetical protein
MAGEDMHQRRVLGGDRGAFEHLSELHHEGMDVQECVLVTPRSTGEGLTEGFVSLSLCGAGEGGQKRDGLISP